MNHKRILVFTIIVACISLVVLMPRVANADEAVYQVMEFVGSSYLSYDDAIQNALKAEPSFRGMEVMSEDTMEPTFDNGVMEHRYIIEYYKITNDDSETVFEVSIKGVLPPPGLRPGHAYGPGDPGPHND